MPNHFSKLQLFLFHNLFRLMYFINSIHLRITTHNENEQSGGETEFNINSLLNVCRISNILNDSTILMYLA